MQTICNRPMSKFDPVFHENHPILQAKTSGKFKFLVKNNLYRLFFSLDANKC